MNDDSDRTFDADAARKIILDACQQIAKLDRRGEDGNGEQIDSSDVMVYGAALILETKDLQDGSTYITTLSTDSAGEALAFWTVLGYVKYLGLIAEGALEPEGKMS